VKYSRKTGPLNKVDSDWLKKKLAMPIEEKRLLIDPRSSRISISRQCALADKVKLLPLPIERKHLLYIRRRKGIKINAFLVRPEDLPGKHETIPKRTLLLLVWRMS
jgi:hypothetical protein